MKSRSLKVVVTRKLPAPVENRMKELFDVKLQENLTPMIPEKLFETLKGADILVPTLGDKIDKKLLEKSGKNLKLIANYGAGFDHIDIKSAIEKGIIVSNTPDVLTDDTADVTMALVLGVPRRLSEGVRIMESGNWKGWYPTALMGSRISGKLLGILGMGRIGQAVAFRAQNFGLKIHYHNRRRLHTETEAILKANYCSSLDSMLRKIDILSIHVPHTPSTFHLLNARRLALLKKDAVVINTARGEVVDENALTRMLRADQLAGAGLDVYENGNNVNPRLKNLKNVLLLPHMGSATKESRLEMGEKVIINIQTFIDGHRPPDQVLPSMI